jgi:hypothetical protein
VLALITIKWAWEDLRLSPLIFVLHLGFSFDLFLSLVGYKNHIKNIYRKKLKTINF